MEFVTDPPIDTKIREMQKRIGWKTSALLERGVDQTHFILQDGHSDADDFSFFVIGDSGSGKYGGYDPQYMIAEQMHLQREGVRFILHTGDVVYHVGSKEFYLSNFIKPYRKFLAGGAHPEKIAYDQMVFNLPFLPVLGNHDYYDLPLIYGLLLGATQPLRRWFPAGIDWAIGWHGSNHGEAYARAFLDCLDRFRDSTALQQHLDQHYVEYKISPQQTATCLQYEPGSFTQLPNRYYAFRAGGIDFFALDSNTFNAPLPLSSTVASEQPRDRLKNELVHLEQEKRKLLKSVESLQLSADYDAEGYDAERLDELRGELEQLDEARRDVQKQLKPNARDIDWEQLYWLETQLIESLRNTAVRGRVIFFHHPPYVTEATKWYQQQTRVVRNHLRSILDKVAVSVGWRPGDRPLVDVVFNGHAHCLEHLQTLNTGHGDSYIDWIICGASGYSLRRQRKEGTDLEEDNGESRRVVARSRRFIGKNGYGIQKRRPYSFLRVDVQAGDPPKFVIRPFISERYQRRWKHYAAEPFTI